VRFAEEQDTEAREELKQQQVEEPARVAEALEQARPRVFASAWSMGGAAAFLAGMLVMLVLRGLHQEQEVAQVAPERNSREDGSVAVGDSERIASAEMLGPEPRNERARPVGGPLPEKPLPGQRKPPCKLNGEVEIRGGCWNRISDAQPPCEEYAFDWKGACYRPLFSAGRQPTSDSP
jgi:hypothetical protein